MKTLQYLPVHKIVFSNKNLEEAATPRVLKRKEVQLTCNFFL
jgi:hypothetical protein